MNNLYRPSSVKEFSRQDVSRHFANLFKELEMLELSDSARYQLEWNYGKFLDERNRTFYLYHFEPLIEKAVKVLFEKSENPLIVELGCGTGTQSLLFALLGARVIGVDITPAAIQLCQRRQALYESQFGSLEIKFHCANVFEFPLASLAPVDGIYSLFAFNMMHPARPLLTQLLSTLRSGGRFMISDGNQSSFFSMLFRKRPGVLTPSEMREECKRQGCRVLYLEADCVIPPFITRYPWLFQLALKAEVALKNLKMMHRFGLSYTIVAEKV